MPENKTRDAGADENRPGAPTPLNEKLLAALLQQEKPRPFPATGFGTVNCADCHPKKSDYLNLSGVIYPGERLHRQAGLDFLTATGKAEVKRPSQKEVFEAAPPEEKLATLINRLPENLHLQLKEKKFSLTTDFKKLSEILPGTTLSKPAEQVLSGLKSIQIDGNGETKLCLKLDRQSLPLTGSVPILGRLKEINLADEKGQITCSLQTTIAPDGTSKLHLGNLQGVSITLEKNDGTTSVPLKWLELQKDQGKTSISVGLESPYALIGEKKPVIPVNLPLEKLEGGQGIQDLAGNLHRLKEMESLLKTKDVGPLLQDLPEKATAFKETIAAFLSGIETISKKEDTITILRNSQVKHNLGGVDLVLNPCLTLKFSPYNRAPAIDKLGGVTVMLPVPSELGLGDNLPVPIDSLRLSPKYGGQRELTLGTGGIVADYVRVKVDGNMQAVTDAGGNYLVRTRLMNPLGAGRQDKLNLNLRFDQQGNLNMLPSELLDIVSRASAQGADLSLSGAGKVLLSGGTKLAATAGWLFGY
ncbi:MAG: hypothetical protein HY986_10430 [Candidatus Melainabacteria bacterium]|nr:hypothetical protein [Candidatus Melainabacteria bacterium]